MTHEIVRHVSSNYLKSGNFNGTPISALRRKFPSVDLMTELRALIESNSLTLIVPNRHPNPHIRAFEDEDIPTQLQNLGRYDEAHSCLYPTPAHLQKAVKKNRYEGMPFTLRLAYGEPQLKSLNFDLTVLEWYRNDPRYIYEVDDIGGWISVRDEYYLSDDMSYRDKTLLQTFGFSYDKDLNRAVAVFLRYLANLSPEHQSVWNARILTGDYVLHPDYYRINILGEWGERLPIHQAFVDELYHINQMCLLMGRSELFRDDFRSGKPKNFTFLIRPTLHEFNEYVHTLDKMMSENLNRAFFGKDIELEEEKVRSDGKVQVITKGTIQLLEIWLNNKIILSDPKPLQDAIATFKDVRKKRQHPAHTLEENRFDQIYIKQQRELILSAYEAVRTIRLLFANHSKVKSYEVPFHLYKGLIWDI